MYKLVVYVPEAYLEEVKAALFEAGAGRQGNYDCCCWEVAGIGQFRPLSGSNPFIGEQNVVERVPEYRVEVLVDDNLIKAVVQALRRAHPYEEPAFDVWRLEAF